MNKVNFVDNDIIWVVVYIEILATKVSNVFTMSVVCLQ